MKSNQNNILGLVCMIDEPETALEFDAVGGPNSCVREAVNNINYRSTYPGIRAALCVALIAATGEPRKGEAKTDKSGNPVLKDGEQAFDWKETEKDYLNRLYAGKFEVADRPALTQGEAQSVLNQLMSDQPDLFVCDPSPSSRSKKAPKEIENAADVLMARYEQGQGTIEGTFEKLAAVLGCEARDRDNLVAALLAVKQKEARETADRFA